MDEQGALPAAWEGQGAVASRVAPAKQAVSSATADTRAAAASSALLPTGTLAARCKTPGPQCQGIAASGQSRGSSPFHVRSKSRAKQRAAEAADSDSSSAASNISLSDSETLMQKPKQSSMGAWRWAEQYGRL
jgi:hypothetical protein